ncbi:hypothetical protein R5R35_011581 [Gryllus longicercus]|uniref:WAP domain-containing protein n=1 Tax=Gryllus longicercus TaxID=2509291 RepID=A0AAN9VIE1_9ORTH
MAASRLTFSLLISLLFVIARVNGTCSYFKGTSEDECLGVSPESARSCYTDEDCARDLLCCPTGCEWGVCEEQPKINVTVLPQGLRDCGGEDAYIHTGGVIFKRKSKTTYSAKGSVVVDKPFGENVTLELSIWQCDDATSPDTCQYYTSGTYEKFCSQLGDERRLWTSIVKKMPTLKHTCPVAEGEYPLEEEVIEIDALKSSLPVLNGFFKVYGSFLEEGDDGSTTTVGCFNIQAYIIKNL